MNKDKKQLMVINVNGKQCLQIAMDKFQSKDGDNMLDDMELKAGVLSFMQGIDEQYRDGNIGIGQLGTTRDAKLRAVGLYVLTHKTKHNSEAVTQTSLHTSSPNKKCANKEKQLRTTR